MDSMTKEFKELVKSNHIKIISVSEASSQILQKNEMQLGDLSGIETIVEETATHFSLPKFQDSKEERFQNMCQWLREIFGESLSQDKTWDVELFYLKRKRPFQELELNSGHVLQGDSEPSFLSTSSTSRIPSDSWDSWVHIPANNETWMTVSSICFACCL